MHGQQKSFTTTAVVNGQLFVKSKLITAVFNECYKLPSITGSHHVEACILVT